MRAIIFATLLLIAQSVSADMNVTLFTLEFGSGERPKLTSPLYRPSNDPVADYSENVSRSVNTALIVAGAVILVTVLLDEDDDDSNSKGKCRAITLSDGSISVVCP